MSTNDPSPARRLILAGKTLAQFGIEPLACYGLYRFGLWTGHYRRLTPVTRIDPQPLSGSPTAGDIQDVIRLPSGDELRQVLGDQAGSVIAEADEIEEGTWRRFGGPPVPLDLEPPGELVPLNHWTAYEQGKLHWLAGQDVKYLWEPGRFGWAYPLVRAFLISGDERYPRTFWKNAERFFQANPPNLGPQWSSGQEVALRLIALAFCAQGFREAQASTPERLDWLSSLLLAHARRIPVTLVYARSQNNNHLITEAAGLLTAAFALPWAREATSWKQNGLRWLERSLLEQIGPDGIYTQHSLNYHRLMLQAALWSFALLERQGEKIAAPVVEKLSRATGWLAQRVDPQTGCAPNLGHNDGAHILPLAPGGYADHRPTLQAASLTFCGQRNLPPGPWDELALWLMGLKPGKPIVRAQAAPTVATILRGKDTWAELRAVHFDQRPAHADQLNVDLWWRGINLAQDAGTYLYNAPPPWDNALACTRVHNTVQIDVRDQMTRAGRFRWLDWAQAEILPQNVSAEDPHRWISAIQDGYAHHGVRHQRTLEISPDGGWLVTDDLTPTRPGLNEPHRFELHWLLPDWPWEWSGDAIHLAHPYGEVSLQFTAETPIDHSPLKWEIAIVRCGEALLGTSKPDPIMGWVSPTYGMRIPALSLTLTLVSPLPVRLISAWDLPA